MIPIIDNEPISPLLCLDCYRTLQDTVDCLITQLKPSYRASSDLSDFQYGLVLAMTADGANAFFGFVTDRCDFVGWLIGIDDFSCYRNFSYRRGTDLDIVAVYHQQRLESQLTAGVGSQQFNRDGFALGD